MNFLGFFLFDWLGGLTQELFNSLTEAIMHGLNVLFYWLSTFFYDIIRYLYDMFQLLCSYRILSNSIISDLSKRIGIILGILMFFLIAFSIIQLILEPDKLSDSEKGAANIVKKVLIVIVLLGFSGTAFNLLYGIQNTLINSNIISKLLLPRYVDTENFGGMLASNLFTSFYYFDEDEWEGTDDDNVTECQVYFEALKQTILDGDYDLGYNCLNTKTQDANNDNKVVGIMHYNGLLLLGFGIGAAYFLFGYCITVGVRAIQLAFLEIIAPVAIIGHLAPQKETMLNKWFKIYLATYLDVFIRIMIINFAVYLIAVIFEEFESTLPGSDMLSGTSMFFIKAILVMAILTFAKKAPDLLKDIFPSGASKLGFGGPKFKDMLGSGLISGAGKVALGVGTGAVAGVVGGAVAGKSISSALKASAKGAWAGGKAGKGAKGIGSTLSSSFKAASDSVRANRLGERPGFSDRFFHAVGAPTAAERQDENIQALEQRISEEKEKVAVARAQSASYQKVSQAKSSMEDRAEKKLLGKDLKGSMATEQNRIRRLKASMEAAQKSGNAQLIQSASAAYLNALDVAKKNYITAVAQGNEDDGVMKNQMDDLKNTVAVDQTGAFEGMNLSMDSYDSLDKFESVATTKNNKHLRDIAANEEKVSAMERKIGGIKNDSKYFDAHKGKFK